MTDLQGLVASSGGRTREFEYVRGEYAISGENVPYFATSMTVSEALTNLTLAQNLAVDPDEPINLEELMQRDVNEHRADAEISAYLKQSGRLKFFNSLTVVLMPLERGRPQMAFPEDNPSEVEVDEGNGMVRTKAGPVLIRHLKETTFGRISWETQSVAAVVIDGQHRWVAIRNVRDQMAHLLQPDVTRLPILLLVLDDRVGFHPSAGGPNGIVQASRAIFTDINKYAIKVSSEREYLLDDLSLTAVSMRAIMSTGIGKTQVADLDTFPTVVPLALIDWIRPRQTKFEDGPYLTTVQAMHQLVAEVLNSPQPPSTAYASLREWLDRITSRIGLDDVADWPGAAVYKRLDECETEELPFALTASEIKIAAGRFASELGQVIVRLILQATPYRSLANEYVSAGLLGGDAELWLGQNQAARAAWKIQFNQDPQSIADTAASLVKDQYRYAYFVVFQRAFVLAGLEVASCGPSLARIWDSADDLRAVFDIWIKLFNDVISPRLDDSLFWAGTALNPDSTIDYGQRAKKAIFGLVLLVTLPLTDDLEVLRIEGDSLLLSSNDLDLDAYGLLSDTMIVEDPSDNHVKCVGEWRQLLASIGPGRITDDLLRLRRAAARAYRDGLRRYVDQVAATNSVALNDTQRDALVLVLGARRLASVKA